MSKKYTKDEQEKYRESLGGFKTCKKTPKGGCGNLRDVQEFGPASYHSKDGLTFWCKSCLLIYSKGSSRKETIRKYRNSFQGKECSRATQLKAPPVYQQ